MTDKGAGYMQQALLDQLRKITEEERKILDGEAEVDKDLYTSGRDFTVDSRKMLKEGRLIAVRTHTRFVYFPAHRHNFVEVLYVCEGSLTNIIDGKKVVVNKGELLFLNQFTKHEILKAGQNDIAINFMVLPEFFDVAYSMTGNDNMLADFLVNVLRQDEERGEYLHFKVADPESSGKYHLFSGKRRRKPGTDQPDHNGPDLYVSGRIRTVCGDAPSQSVRKYDLHDNPGLY